MKKALILVGLCPLFLFYQTIIPTQANSFWVEKSKPIESNYVSVLPPVLSHPLECKEYKPAFNSKNFIPRKDSVTSEQVQINPIYNKGILDNALKSVMTPTYEGSGQAVHPSVIDFKTEYNLNTWRGYRYWMVMTPYPGGFYHRENPTLLASQDGQEWVVPADFAKPLDVRTEKNNFNSDPCLVYDADNKALLIYWRETLKGQYDQFWRIKLSEKGKPEPKILVFEQSWGKPAQVALSPSIWRKNAKEWYMWVSDGEGAVYLYDSQNGISWGNRRLIQTPWKSWNDGFIPWHLEVKPYLKQNKLALIISGWPKSGKTEDQVLVYAETSMNDLTSVSMPLGQPLLIAGIAPQWDDDFIYKSSFVMEDKNGQSFLHIWYSAHSTDGTWHTGYTEGALSVD